MVDQIREGLQPSQQREKSVSLIDPNLSVDVSVVVVYYICHIKDNNTMIIP